MVAYAANKVVTRKFKPSSLYKTEVFCAISRNAEIVLARKSVFGERIITEMKRSEIEVLYGVHAEEALAGSVAKCVYSL